MFSKKYFYSKKYLFAQKTTCTKKSRIRETQTLSTDADSRTNTNLKRLRDLSNFFFLRGDQWEAGICSYDLRTNERPRKKLHRKGTRNRRTSRLLGRVGEKYITQKILVLKKVLFPSFLKNKDCTMFLLVLTSFLKRHDLSLSRLYRYYRDFYKNHLPQF